MEAETTAWVNNIETAESITVPTAWVTAVDNLIVALKANGSWAKLDRLWLWNARFNNYARRLDVKNLELGTVVGGLTPVDTGYQGDGTTGYFNTHFVPSTELGNYTQNSASFGQFYETDLNEVKIQGTRNQFQMSRWNVNSAYYQSKINTMQGGVLDPTYAPAPALYHVNRDTSTNAEHYANGSLLGFEDTASALLPSNEFYCFAQNDGSTATYYSTHTASIMFFGSNLKAEASSLYTALNNYRTVVAGISAEVAITVVKDGVPLQGAIVKFIQMDPFALDGADNTSVFQNATLLPGVFLTNASGYAKYDGVFDSTKVQMAVWLDSEYDTEWKVEILGEIGSENINQTAPI